MHPRPVKMQIKRLNIRVHPRKSVAEFSPPFSFPFHKEVSSSTVSAQASIDFPLRIDSECAHSAHSANVSCIEPARDCNRAGGDRWFSRVNHREGFRNALRCVPGNSGVAASSESPSLKSWTGAARLLNRSGPMFANLEFADGLPAGCPSERALLRECGFLSSQFAA